MSYPKMEVSWENFTPRNFMKAAECVVVIASACLFIYFSDSDLFIELDFSKLLLLSASMSLPLLIIGNYFGIAFFLFNKGRLSIDCKKFFDRNQVDTDEKEIEGAIAKRTIEWSFFMNSLVVSISFIVVSFIDLFSGLNIKKSLSIVYVISVGSLVLANIDAYFARRRNSKNKSSELLR